MPEPSTATEPAPIVGLNGAPASEVAKRLRATFDSGRTRSAAWRRGQLRAVDRMLGEREDELTAALRADLGKPAIEAFVTELAFVRSEIAVALRELDGWMAPTRARVPLKQRPGRAEIVWEPLGVVLVIAPWNYPVHLVLAPLVAALAAGDCALLKPSEVTEHTAAVLADLIPQYLDPDAVAVVTGGVPETTALLDERWDHIFYTGNGTVGRVVMEAAARHLTPVTLELGGKSPAIVDRSADLDVAARRIAWGKFVNAGQTCVAPDYVLADHRIERQLTDRIAQAVTELFGMDPARSADYGRIVNDRHLDRLLRLLAADGAGTVVTGGDHDRPSRYLAPTVLRDTDPASPLMQEEIFGPLLPVIPVDDAPAAVDFVNERDRPLALYVFAEDDDVTDHVLRWTSSGGAVVNHTLLHLAVPSLPFGGVGASGTGAYHGRHGFERLSHAKSVLRKPTGFDPPIVYPPYTRWKQWVLRRFL